MRLAVSAEDEILERVNVAAGDHSNSAGKNRAINRMKKQVSN